MYTLPPQSEPNEEEKAMLRSACVALMEYYKTPEGILEGNILSYLVKKWREEDEARFASLTDTEKKALAFETPYEVFTRLINQTTLR